MKFLKENSYDIVRLIINQIGITIFSLVLSTAVGMVDLDDDTRLIVKLVLSIFSTLFYFALLYTAAWEWGAKDKIRIDGGRMESDKFKGAKMAFFANLINFALALLCAIPLAIHYFANVEALYSFSSVFNLIIRLIASMYIGILQAIFVAFKADTVLYFLLQSIGFVFMPLLAICATQIGYHFGTLEKKIFSARKK